MPRFYFHLHEYELTGDEEGLELPDIAAAMEHALDSAREMVCANILERRGVNLDHYVEVANEDGSPLFRIVYRDAFSVES